jgi:hypothetical protein
VDVVENERRFATIGQVPNSCFEIHSVEEATQLEILSNSLSGSIAVVSSLLQRSAAHPLLPEPPNNKIYGHTIEPGRKCRFTSKRLYLSKDLHEYVLRKIFCLCGISQHALAETQDEPAMGVIDDFERLDIVTGKRWDFAPTL